MYYWIRKNSAILGELILNMENSTTMDEYNASVWSYATALNVTPTIGAGGGGWTEDGVSTATVGAGVGGLAEDGVSTEADRALTISYIVIGTVGIIGKSYSFFLWKFQVVVPSPGPMFNLILVGSFRVTLFIK